MFSRTKAVYLIGSLILGLLTISIVFVGLIAGGVINVVRTELVLTAGSAEKYYDGKELVCDDWSLTYGALQAGHTMQVVVSGSQTESGVGKNYIYATIYDENGVDVTEDYAITYQYGDLKVNPRIITIEGNDASKQYDGTPLTEKGYIIKGTTIGDDYLDIYTTGSQINAGTGENMPVAQVLDKDGNENGKNYNVICKPGNLLVTPIPVTFKSIGAEQTYNASPLTTKSVADAVKLEYGSLLAGHEFTADVTGTLTNAGSKDNTFDIIIYDTNNGNNDVTSNYDITSQYGQLIVNPERLIMTTGSSSFEYDATVHSNSDYTFGSDTIINKFGLQFEVTFDNTIKNAGTVENSAKYSILNSNNEDVTENFEVDEKFGTLTVNKKTLVINTENATQVYNATPLTRTTLDAAAISSQVLPGQAISAQVIAALTNKGVEKNDVLVSIIDENGEDVAGNYEIDTSAIGTLVVTGAPLTISASGSSKYYDGTPLVNNEIIYDKTKLVSGQTLLVDEIKTTGEITNAGICENAIELASVKIVDALGNDVTQNYILNLVPKQLIVKPIELYYQSETRDLIYNGAPFSSEDVTFSRYNGKLVDKQTAVIANKLILENAEGVKTANTYEVKVFTENDVDVSSNYNIHYSYGYLTYYPKTITFKSISSSKVYDGISLTTEGVDGAVYPSDGAVLVGQSYQITSCTVLNSCGTAKNDFTVTIKDNATGTIVASTEDTTVRNYKIVKDCGLLDLMFRSYTINSKSIEKLYDGTVLKADADYTQSITTSGALADGDVLQVTMSSAALTGIVDAGTIDNSFTYAILHDGYDVSTTCYKVSFNFGKITVNPCEVILESATVSKTYDGTKLSSNSVSIKKGNIPTGYTIEKKASGELTNAGSIANKITYTIKNGADVVVTNDGEEKTNDNYIITLNEGTITVNPRNAYVQTISCTKEYTGESLKPEEDKISITNLLSGSSVTKKPTILTSLTYAGTAEFVVSDDIIIKDGSGNDVTSNYTFVYTNGTFEVTPKALVVSAKTINSTSEYYSVPLKCNEIEYASGVLSDLDEIVSWAVSGECLKYNVEYENIMQQVVIKRKAGKTGAGTVVTGCYDITYVNGTLFVAAEVSPTVSMLENTNDNIDMSTVAFEVYSTQTNPGSIYLKQQNSGDYVTNYKGTGTSVFAAAPIYGYDKTAKNVTASSLIGKVESGYAASYLTSDVLGNSSTPTYNVIVNPKFTQTYYALPLYTVMDTTDTTTGTGCYISNGKYAIQVADSANTKQYLNKDGVYSFNVYDYDYLKDSAPSGSVSTANLAIYNDYYNNWVKLNYINVPTDTKAYIDTIIASKGWSSLGTTKAKIQAVKDYLTDTTVFSYSKDYDRNVDYQADAVVAFLSLYKTGVCRHFAAAATLIFRALGIPARYTVGVRADIVNVNAWTEITLGQGHAWVEVFVEGIGWVNIDPTPSTGESNQIKTEITASLTVRPLDNSVAYVNDSTFVVANNYSGLSTYLSLNQDIVLYSITFGGKQIGAGQSKSYVSELILKNKSGVIVYQYHAIADGIGRKEIDTIGLDITYKSGLLTVYKGLINITTGSASKTYDGTALTCNSFEYDSKTYYSDSNGDTFSDAGLTSSAPIIIETGVGMRVKFKYSITDKGNKTNSVDVTFYDATSSSKPEISTSYTVNVTAGKLTIDKRTITITDVENHMLADGSVIDEDEFIWDDEVFSIDEETGDVDTFLVRKRSDETDVSYNYIVVIEEE